MNESVSVIIPVFNAEKTIKECINALLQQKTNEVIELIVVDDGSTDNSLNSLNGFGKKIKLFRQSNRGPASARNLGIHKSSGSILLFIDSDCIAESNWIEEMIKPFKNESVFGVQGRYKSKQKELIARFIQLEVEQRYKRMNELNSIDFIGSYSAAYRREVFNEGGFNECFSMASGEDIELSYRLNARGLKLVFNPNAIVFHFHPTKLIECLKTKFFRGYWRIPMYSGNKSKLFKGDSYSGLQAQSQFLLANLFFVSLIASIYLFNAFPFVLAFALLLLSNARTGKELIFFFPLIASLNSIAGTIGVYKYLLDEPSFKQFSFDFHGIMKLKIVLREKAFFENYLLKGIDFFLSKKEFIEPDLLIEVGEFIPRNNECILVDDKYYVKENYVYGIQRYKLGKWFYEIEFIEERITVKVKSNFFGYLFFPAFLNDSLIALAFAMKGFALIHSSGITKNGNAFLFPARSGSGKTVISMHFIEKGYGFLGDNLVLLGKGIVFAYPSALNVFSYNLNSFIKQKMTLMQKAMLSFNALLYRMTFGYAKFFSSVNASKAFSERIVLNARLDSIYFLLARNSTELKARKATESELMDRLFYNNLFESINLLPALMSYSYVFPNSFLNECLKSFESSLKDSLRNSRLFLVEVPGKLKESHLIFLRDLIEGKN